MLYEMDKIGCLISDMRLCSDIILATPQANHIYQLAGCNRSTKDLSRDCVHTVSNVGAGLYEGGNLIRICRNYPASWQHLYCESGISYSSVTVAKSRKILIGGNLGIIPRSGQASPVG